MLEDQDTPANVGRWIRVCEVRDVPCLGARIVRHSSGDIALFRAAGDEFFALLDRCPHRGGPLSQGVVFGKTVACPLHGWNIALEDGRACQPDVGSTACFAVKVVDGFVYLDPRLRDAPDSDDEPSAG